MDSSGLVPLLELLDDNIDDLEEALKPLLSSSLVESAGKLPLLDKAQLYVLVTYAIESVLFCQFSFTLEDFSADWRSISSIGRRQCTRSSGLP